MSYLHKTIHRVNAMKASHYMTSVTRSPSCYQLVWLIGQISHDQIDSIHPREIRSSIWAAAKDTVYPKKYAHGFCFAVLCCGYTLTDFPISIRLTSLALRQSNDCPSASKATLMNMDKYFMWIHYERLHNHNKAKHNKTVCIFLGVYCTSYRLWWNTGCICYAMTLSYTRINVHW